ncbi:MAG TPA: hypothetical protein VGL99_04015 [Chloroflexota bacterium]
MGDPEAVSTSRADADDWLPDVPLPFRSQLRRAGFIELDGPHLHGADKYVPGDRIADVVGDTVRLRPAPSPAQSVTDTYPHESKNQSQSVQQTAPAPLGTKVGAHREPEAPSMPTWCYLGGAAATATGAAIGLWWYIRERQRNRPVNRARRALAELTEQIEQTDRRVAGGAATAAAATLLAGWLVRRTADHGQNADVERLGRAEVIVDRLAEARHGVSGNAPREGLSLTLHCRPVTSPMRCKRRVSAVDSRAAAAVSVLSRTAS